MASINLNSNLVKTVMLKVIGDGGDANRMLDELAAKAEALKKEHPELTVQIDRAKAMADAVVAKAEMRRVFDEPIKVKVDVDKSGALNFLKSLATPRGWGSLIPGIGAPETAASLGGGAGGIAKFLASPAGLVAAVAAVVASSPLVVSLLGGLVGGGAAAGALKIASNANANLTALQTTATSAQAALTAAQQHQQFYPSAANAAAVATASANLAQANQAVTAFQRGNSPALGLYAAMQGVGSAASAAFMGAITGNATRTVQDRVGHGLGTDTHTEQAPGTSFLSGLGRIIGPISAFIKTEGPQLGQMFRASLPYVDAWVKIFEGFASRAIPAVTSALQHFARFMPDMVHFFNGISDAVAAVIRAFGWMAESVGITGQQMLRVVRDIKSGWGSFETWIQGLINNIGKWFGNLPGELFSIGKNMVGSLIHGLESVSVFGTITNLASGWVNRFKHALGISSPSTVAMGLGRNFTQGFYIGLAQTGQGVGVSVSGYGHGGGTAGGGSLMIAPGAGGVLEQAIVQIIRQYVISRGGGGKNSVQVAFGQHS